MTKELWQTTYEWLKLCGNRINKDYCKEELTTHPDYPALTSVTDLLDSGDMAYKALQTDTSYINDFNYPLLAHIRQPGNEYMFIVPDIRTWDDQNEITRFWTGIVLFPQKGARWKNKQNDLCRNSAVKNNILVTMLAMAGLTFFAVSTFFLLSHSRTSGGGLIPLFGLFSLAGFIVSLFALGAELGFQSQLVKQVCGVISSGGCEQVLRSRFAKGVAGVTPADVSVLYFATQFTAYVVSPFYPGLLSGGLLLAFAGVPVAGLSIYLQAVKLRQWCALCLAIVAVLVVQTFLSFTIPVIAVPYAGLGGFIFLSLLLAFVFLAIKQLIKTNNGNKIKLAELKRWKFDAGIFMNQWQQEQEVDATVWENDLLVGDPDAPLQLTIACNPYCGPCARAHKQVDVLLRRYANKIKVQIRLLCTVENEQDRRTIAARAILQKASALKDPYQVQTMLTDWFEWMDYDKWVEKWSPDNVSLPDRSAGKSRLVQHGRWIEQSNIAYTPSFFVNGRRLPGRYSLDDLETLIPQLIGQV